MFLTTDTAHCFCMYFSTAIAAAGVDGGGVTIKTIRNNTTKSMMQVEVLPCNSRPLTPFPINCSSSSRCKEYYQSAVLQEKQTKQEYNRRKTPKNVQPDRTGLTVPIIRRQMSWPDKNPQEAKQIQISLSAATDDSRQFSSCRSTIHSEQPLFVAECEHNVIKPEYHLGSIKYRIQLFANYHVPDVLLVRCEKPLKPGTSTELILKLTNPTMYHMTTTIMKLPTKEEERRMITSNKSSTKGTKIHHLEKVQ
ncbi:uncharacterized protein LOC129944677 [Eupeodes corollae]|uniref:uncharacterized protein LOC129944677 n=1 Tax=Eupeodes corollae TaxID=290404 RepID=UPI00249030F6|nr:uncharacterized protein LOC129944677 [Eupeodes corollae]